MDKSAPYSADVGVNLTDAGGEGGGVRGVYHSALEASVQLKAADTLVIYS